MYQRDIFLVSYVCSFLWYSALAGACTYSIRKRNGNGNREQQKLGEGELEEPADAGKAERRNR